VNYQVRKKLVGPPRLKGGDQQCKDQLQELGLSSVNIGAKTVNHSIFTDDTSLEEQVVELMEG